MKKRGSQQKNTFQRRNYLVLVTVFSIALVVLFSHSIFQNSSSITGLDVGDVQTPPNLYQQLADKALEEQDLYTKMAQNTAERQKILVQIAQQQTVSVNLLTPPPSNCFESDGGKDYYFKSENNNQGDTPSPADQCVLTGYVTPPLKEYYCDGNDQMTTKIVGCPNGCKDGACIGPKPTPGVCFDTDPNNDPVKKGRIGIIDDSFVFATGSYNDVCTSETILNQVSCNKDLSTYATAKYPLDSAKVLTLFNCPTGQKCSDGACVKK